MKMSSMKFTRIMKVAQVSLFFIVLLVAGTVFAQTAEAAPEAAAAVTASAGEISTATKYIAIALIMVFGSMAASMAVGKVGAAAMGAAAEKPELLAKAIIYVGLGEGIALFGFLISLFLLNK